MTREELINLILEKYDNVKISKMKSYKKYNDFAKLDKSFFFYT